MGKEIDLQKRVVQVWFQNARAKEKKNPHVYKSDLPENFQSENDFCRICSSKYTIQNPQRVRLSLLSSLFSLLSLIRHRSLSDCLSFQDHLFTSKHIENLRRILFKQPKHYSSTASSIKDESNPIKSNSENLLDSSSVFETLKSENKWMTSPSPSTRKSATTTTNSSSSSSSLLSYLNLMNLMPMGFDPFNCGLVDPNLHGIPIFMLQLPGQLIEKIFKSIQTDCHRSRIQYSQDQIDFDVEKLSNDRTLIQYQTIDVGFVCKRCQLVCMFYYRTKVIHFFCFCFIFPH